MPKTKRPTNFHPAAAFLDRILPSDSVMEIEWFGLVGYIRIQGRSLSVNRAHVQTVPHGLRVRVELSTAGYGGHYVGLRLSLEGAAVGKIDEVFVRFSDVLDPDKRRDTRTDRRGEPFQIVDHCGWDWYLFVPADESPIHATVARYVAMWSEP